MGINPYPHSITAVLPTPPVSQGLVLLSAPAPPPAPPWVPACPAPRHRPASRLPAQCRHAGGARVGADSGHLAAAPRGRLSRGRCPRQVRASSPMFNLHHTACMHGCCPPAAQITGCRGLAEVSSLLVPACVLRSGRAAPWRSRTPVCVRGRHPQGSLHPGGAQGGCGAAVGGAGDRQPAGRGSPAAAAVAAAPAVRFRCTRPRVARSRRRLSCVM